MEAAQRAAVAEHAAADVERHARERAERRDALVAPDALPDADERRQGRRHGGEWAGRHQYSFIRSMPEYSEATCSP